MKVGYIQFAPRLGDLEANRRAVERRVREAPPADLLVLPELCSSGYRFASREQARQCSEPAAGGPFVELLERLSRERGCSLVSGFCERDGDRLFNSAVLVTPDGLRGVYRKLHLFLDEKDLFTPGDLGLPVFDLPPCRVGVLICFDWQFPEAWRVLALRGADLVCHPSNLVLPGLAQRSIPAHALLNRLFVVTANRIGVESDLSFTGRSIIVEPKGRVLHEADPEAEETYVAEIDPRLARDKSVTTRNDLLADRRPEHYGDLLRPPR
jgi:predicted amidohydrolase